MYLRFRNGTSNQTTNNYYTTYHSSYYNGSGGGVNNNNDKATYMRLANWNQPNGSNTYGSNWHFDFGDLTQDYPKVSGSHAILDQNMDNIVNMRMAGIYNISGAGINGFTLYWSGGANFRAQGTATLYGLK